MTKTIAVLDIGTTKVVATIIRKQAESTHLEVIGVGNQPFLSISKGTMINIESASQSIKKAIEKSELMAGEEINEIFISIPSEQVEGIHSRGIIAIAGKGKHSEKEVDVQDIQRVLDMAESISIPNDKAVLHVIPCEFTVDDLKVEEPLGASGVRLEVNIYLITCIKSVLDNIYKSINKVGLSISNITLQSIASAEGVLTNEEKRAGSIVIDIGGEVTDVVFYYKNSIWHTYSIPLGGNHVTKDLAFGLRTTLARAEEVKKQYGVAIDSLADPNNFFTVPLISYKKVAKVSQKTVANIIGPRIEEILKIIHKNVSQTKYIEKIESGIVITGGGSLCQGTIEIAENVFNRPVRMGDPIEITGIEEEFHSPIYSTCIGLARLAFNGHFEEVNTNPVTSKEEGKLQKFISYFKSFLN